MSKWPLVEPSRLLKPNQQNMFVEGSVSNVLFNLRETNECLKMVILLVYCQRGIMIVVVLHTFKWFSIAMVLAAILPKSMRDRLNLHRKAAD